MPRKRSTVQAAVVLHTPSNGTSGASNSCRPGFQLKQAYDHVAQQLPLGKLELHRLRGEWLRVVRAHAWQLCQGCAPQLGSLPSRMRQCTRTTGGARRMKVWTHQHGTKSASILTQTGTALAFPWQVKLPPAYCEPENQRCTILTPALLLAFVTPCWSPSI